MNLASKGRAPLRNRTFHHAITIYTYILFPFYNLNGSREKLKQEEEMPWKQSSHRLMGNALASIGIRTQYIESQASSNS